jgi:hypothetical protein
LPSYSIVLEAVPERPPPHRYGVQVCGCDVLVIGTAITCCFVLLFSHALCRSAFWWLISLALVAFVAWAVHPLRGILPVLLPLGVLTQELLRGLYFNAFIGLCRRLKAASPSIEFTVQEQLSIGAGTLGNALCGYGMV